ncbi:MAG: hypothetical protein AAFU57_09355 [Bacteroidota bacterium]
MKPRIAIFGLPPLSSGEISIWLYKNPSQPHNHGTKVFQGKNNESGFLFDYAHSDIDLGDTITIVIMSSGIQEYSHRTIYDGTDISHVPFFRKEVNTSEKAVSKNWNLTIWKKWNPSTDNQIGMEEERRFILTRKISVAPLWESYFADSKINYFEKFHKLWIGLNAFASKFSDEKGDKHKILALVNSPLRKRFNSKLNALSNLQSEEKWNKLMDTMGIDLTPQIVGDEIAQTTPLLDFLELSQNSQDIFADIQTELKGTTFLDKNNGKSVFQHIFSKYLEFAASEQGIVEPMNLALAFEFPKSPKSTKRIGRFIYHNPFESNSEGTLFSLKDYFGTDYASNPYQGQTHAKLSEWEKEDPLFFKYLFVLYKFRCAYFHGNITPNLENIELAKAAYISLYEIFSAIIGKKQNA